MFFCCSASHVLNSCPNPHPAHSFLHFPHGFPHGFRRAARGWASGRLAVPRCVASATAGRCRRRSLAKGADARAALEATTLGCWRTKSLENCRKNLGKSMKNCQHLGENMENWRVNWETTVFWCLFDFFLGLDVEICWMTSCFREICVSTFVCISGSSDLFPLNSPSLDKYLPTVSQSIYPLVI